MDTLLLQAEQQGSSLLSSSQKQPEKASKSGADPAVNIKRAPVNLEPIILVPQAPSAVITKWNIKRLLEDGEYVTREQQKASGYKPEERISVMHQVSAPSCACVCQARAREKRGTPMHSAPCAPRPLCASPCTSCRCPTPVGEAVIVGRTAAHVRCAGGQRERAARRQCQECVCSTSVGGAGVSAGLAFVCERCSATVAGGQRSNWGGAGVGGKKQDVCSVE